MNRRNVLLKGFALVLGLVSSAAGDTTWCVDFQGDSDHLGLYAQTNPVDHIESGVTWNTFEVQAFNSIANSEYESNTSMTLLDAGGNDTGVTLSFAGDLVGWSGSSGADSLVGDYLILASFAGIDTSSVSWTISGLDANTEYDLTSYAHNDQNPVRGIDFAISGEVFFTQMNTDSPITVRVLTELDGKIVGTAMNMLEPSAEGDWAGLQIERVPEPSSPFLGILGLISLVLFGSLKRPVVSKRENHGPSSDSRWQGLLPTVNKSKGQSDELSYYFRAGLGGDFCRGVSRSGGCRFGWTQSGQGLPCHPDCTERK